MGLFWYREILFGIGLKRSQEILENTKISPDVRIKDLSHEQIGSIQKFINKNYRVEGDLHKEITLNIKRLQEIGSYRGLRHKRSLPVRGQRTKTNARTRKGPKRPGGAVALKKTITKK